jgi:transposase
MRSVAQKLGVGTTETVRKWVRKVDAGARPGVTSKGAAELR